jgi:thiol-disulfide isomerase/thioredoxin
MNPMLLVAAILVVLLICSLPLLKYLTHTFIVHKARHAQIEGQDSLLVSLQTGKPAIIYFTSPGCGPCRLMQKPILDQLQEQRGDSVQIMAVSIDQPLEDALRWGVMKAPRTFVLDRNLRAYATNLDVATLRTLTEQLDEAEKHADEPVDALKIVGDGKASV